MANKQDYENLQMGFDRTQLYKEYTQPQINRSTALQVTLNWSKVNQYKLELPEIIALTEHFVNYIENGKKDWMTKTEEKIKEKLKERMSEIDGILID
jgi:hypothetical protein